MHVLVGHCTQCFLVHPKGSSWSDLALGSALALPTQRLIASRESATCLGLSIEPQCYFSWLAG